MPFEATKSTVWQLCIGEKNISQGDLVYPIFTAQSTNRILKKHETQATKGAPAAVEEAWLPGDHGRSEGGGGPEPRDDQQDHGGRGGDV